MHDPEFFQRALTPTIDDIITWTGAAIAAGADRSQVISQIAPLDQGEHGSLTFIDNPKYINQLAKTRASACLVAPRYAGLVPAGTIALSVREPYAAFALVVAKLYPESLRPQPSFATKGISPAAFVHSEARLEHGVVVEPGAVIGLGAEIGAGTLVGANAVIGPNVRIGRECAIAAHVSLSHCLIGNHVIIHPGVRIGQDGFGFAMSARGHLKVPQIGRVIIQDHVEIGANTTIDRGANRDTLIGEGTKIDNLVQIGHNVTIGRHCVIVAQVAIAGSTQLADFVSVGGQAGFAGHLQIGVGAQISAQAGVMNNIPAGERWGGTPAQPIRDFFRTVAGLQRLLRDTSKKAGTGE